MRLGAIHSPRPPAIKPLGSRASLHLMVPPPSADWHAASPADGDALANDRYGCCVEIADWRIIQMRHANVWGDNTKPSVDVILARYSALTGFNRETGLPDNGTDTVADMRDWCSHGIRVTDQTIDVPLWASVDPLDSIDVNLAIAHTGPIAVTVALPLAAQDYSTWAQAPGQGPDSKPGSWGMHRIACGKYNGVTRIVRTWGQDLEVHPEWWKAYVVAVDATLSREWMDTTGLAPSHLDWDALRSDMAAL